MNITMNYLNKNRIKKPTVPSEITGVFQHYYSDVFIKERLKKDLIKNLLLKLHNIDRNETLNHLKMVGRISVMLSAKVGFSEYESKKIGFFAKLHDIGKIGVPDKIINKPRKLTVDEFEVVKEHTEIGYHLVRKFGFSKVGENIIRYHHEKWNGKGYKGLVGDEIPLEARIVAIADVYDALRMKRVYKDAYSHEKAIEIIIEGKGKDFDPELVDIFLNCHQEVKKIYNSYLN